MMSVQLTLFDLDLYTVQPKPEPPLVKDSVAQEKEHSKVQQLELPLFPELKPIDCTHYLAA